MKVKLLKKVRKRFEILHLPNGYISHYGQHWDFDLYKLVDNNHGDIYDQWAQKGRKDSGRQFCNEIFETDKECIDHLLSLIIERLRSEGYRQRKDNVIKTKVIKVWHK